MLMINSIMGPTTCNLNMIFCFQFVSIYAAYLYDSVKLYAKALDEIIKEETRTEMLTMMKLHAIATNGTRIVAKMIQSSPYKSKLLVPFT